MLKQFYDPKTGVAIMSPIKPTGWLSEDEWTEEAKTAANMSVLRIERNKRLAETDWMATPDQPISDESAQDIFAYRQALRDLPNNPDAPWTPDTIPWPELPQVQRAQHVITTLPWLETKTEAKEYTPKENN